MRMQQESLVILGKGVAAATVEALVRVHQRFGERVLFIHADDESRLQSLHGIEVVPSGSQTAVPSTGFTETEKMGLAVWNARGDMEQKVRRSDGLAWDTPDFEAP
jgi:CO dehydrogenase nickel-insertion accessory protein CooC1